MLIRLTTRDMDHDVDRYDHAFGKANPRAAEL